MAWWLSFLSRSIGSVGSPRSSLPKGWPLESLERVAEFPLGLFLVVPAELLALRRREVSDLTPELWPGAVCCRWPPNREGGPPLLNNARAGSKCPLQLVNAYDRHGPPCVGRRRLGTRGGVPGERCQVERSGLHATRSNCLQAGARVGPSWSRPTQDRVGLLLAMAAHPNQRNRSRVEGDKPTDQDRSKTSRLGGGDPTRTIRRPVDGREHRKLLRKYGRRLKPGSTERAWNRSLKVARQFNGLVRLFVRLRGHFVGTFSLCHRLHGCVHVLHDTFTEALPLIEPVCVSVAVSVCVPLLLKVIVKVCTPASAATNV